MPVEFGEETISQQAEQSCAQEPIRTIGTVQPHGFVVVVDVATALIVQVSTGIARHWPGLDPERLLHAPLGDWIDGVGSDPGALLQSLPSEPKLLPFQPRLRASRAELECVGHRMHDVAVLEWQSLGEGPDALDEHGLIEVMSALVRLRSTNALDAFYRDCVREVSRLCGFDRVMLYRFLPDWTGEVLAEEVQGGLETRFLGLRFPASDIPSQARALYTESRIRVLADVRAEPDTLAPPLLPGGEPLDQSHCVLRGLSDVHRTYLANMGVRATMSLSIVCDGKLWGLMACHHYQPRIARQALRMSLRRVCELIAEVVALRVEALEQLAAARDTMALDRVFTQFEQAVVQEYDTRAVLRRMLPAILSALQASGLCIRVADWCFVGGETQSAASETDILQEVAARFGFEPPTASTLEISDLLAADGAPLVTLPSAAGLLAAAQPAHPVDICAFIRPEVVHEVHWAGAPAKEVVTAPDGRVRLEPRRSFKLWKETVAGTARPWSRSNVRSCERLLRILSDASRRQMQKAMEQKLRDRIHRDYLTNVQRANHHLEREVGVRIQAEEDLRRVNATLEIRVADRTAQFEALNRILIEEGARFAIAADAAGLGFWDFDIGTRVLQWDERMFHLYGHVATQRQQPYSVWMSSLHPEDRERCEQESTDAGNGTRSYDTEFRIVHPNGAIRHLRAAGGITRDLNGQPVRMLGVTFDITEHKNADEQFRLAIEAAPTGMLLMNPTGTIVLVNAQIEALFGYARTELLGRPFEMLVPERLRGSNTGTATHRYGLRKDGAEIPIEIGLNPLHTSEGEFVLSSIVDLSQRLEIDRLRNEFVSTVSHELRTPLTSISGALGLLDAGVMGALPGAAADLVRIAYKNSGRLGRLINDILDIGTLEAGKLNIQMVRVPLVELLKQSVEANLSYAEKYKVRYLLDEASAHHEVFADPDRLMQVLANLLSNAAKFSPPGSDIGLRVRAGSARIRIEVEDSGPGIPDEFQDIIFEKFSQADSSASRSFEGTGLGLSIARELIEAMGGSIGFTTVVAQGTVFFVELARFEAAQADDDERPYSELPRG
jgi:PAS domain S-box-containing protein